MHLPLARIPKAMSPLAPRRPTCSSGRVHWLSGRIAGGRGPTRVLDAPEPPGPACPGPRPSIPLLSLSLFSSSASNAASHVRRVRRSTGWLARVSPAPPFTAPRAKIKPLDQRLRQPRGFRAKLYERPTPASGTWSRGSRQVSWLVDRCFPAPSRLAAVASCEVAPHSQWRARAGFSPASLFSPCGAPRAYSCFRRSF